MTTIPPSLDRTAILIGESGLTWLAGRHVLVAGLGGVGSYAAEALARSGIGRLTLLDHDLVGVTNLNRQLPALHSTLGRPKVAVMAERLLDIRPDIQLDARQAFIHKEQTNELVADGGFDYVVDCIDSLACKTALLAACQRQEVPVVASLGTGGRLDVSRVRLGTLGKTEICPLARELRTNLRRLGLSLDIPVVWSDEPPQPPLPPAPLDSPVPGRPRAVNGSIGYLPGLFGMMLAGWVVTALLGSKNP